MKKFLFAFFFAFAVFAFSGCSEDDGGSASEPSYNIMPIAMYASFTSAQRSDYVTALNNDDFTFSSDSNSYQKNGLYASFISQNSKWYLLLMADEGETVYISSYPSADFASRVSAGYYKIYNVDASAYFNSQRSYHQDQGDEYYSVEGDSSAYAYCREVGTSKVHCWEYDTEDGYFVTFYDMDRDFFYDDFVSN
jgi:hypothetical protein